MANNTTLERVGLAFARQFYEPLVNELKNPFEMLDDETVYTNGEDDAPARQRSVVGRGKINLDLELSVFRGKELKLTFVDTQQTFDEGLLVLVSGAAVDASVGQSREFVQTFLLGKDPVEGGFFIRNTVVRFLQPAKTAPAPAPAVAAAATTTATPAPAAAPAVATPTQTEPAVAAPVATPAPTPVAAPAQTAASAAAAPQTQPAAPSSEKPSEKKGSGKEGKRKGKKEAGGDANKKEGEDKAPAAKSAAPPASSPTPIEGSAQPSSAPAAATTAATTADASRTAAAAAPKAAPSSFLDAARRPAAPAAARPVNGAQKPSAPNGAKAEKKQQGGATAPATAASTKEKKPKDPSRSKMEKHAQKLSHINPNAQCYVSNIAFNSANADLEALLSKFGKIKSINRPVNKGYGFVEYESDDDAQKAIENAAGIDLSLDGRELKIELRTGTGSGSPAPTKTEKRAPRRNNSATSNSRPKTPTKPKTTDNK